MIVGRTYARAIYELGQEQNLLDVLSQELQEVADLIQNEADLQKLLFHPQISSADKKDILKTILQGQANPLTWNTLQLIIDRKRESFLPEIVQELKDIIREENKIVVAEVTTAIPLDKDQAHALEEKIAVMMNVDNIELKAEVDPEIIGGIIIRVGNTLIDDSIKKHLELIKQESQAV